MVKNFPVIDGIYQNKMLDDLYSSKYGVEILIVNFIILLLTAACPRSLQNQWKRTSLNRCVQTVTMETSTHQLKHAADGDHISAVLWISSLLL